ncbi:MAG: hypothetical protein L0Y66_01460 [Myxococcaceae bacterium]|nr:hypothetical protein [Myxococcaceae bacterium]MCI0669799.1 hypothetical protein [Myxococcaceae bacterium]
MSWKPSSLKLLLIGSIVVVTACIGPKVASAPGPLSTESLQLAQARMPHVTAESLEAGRQLFVASCKRCHAYPDLAAHTEERWPQIAQVMGEKAKLSETERTQLLEFVLAARAPASAHAAP